MTNHQCQTTESTTDVFVCMCVCVCWRVQPLQLYSDQPTLTAVRHVLKSKTKTEADLRTVFQPVTACLSEAVTRVLTDFRSKSPTGRYWNGRMEHMVEMQTHFYTFGTYCWTCRLCTVWATLSLLLRPKSQVLRPKLRLRLKPISAVQSYTTWW